MERGLSRCATSSATVRKKTCFVKRLAESPHPTEEGNNMELLVVLGVIYVVYLIYRSGKREGSKKAFRVGWDRGRRGRGRRRR